MHLRSPDGFTLLDLLIGALVTALVLATAIPSLSTVSDSHRLLSATRTTVGYLRMLRTTAVAHRRTSRLTLNNDGRVLGIEVLEGGTWTPTGLPLVLDGVRIASVSPLSGVQFSPQGIAAAPATLTLQTSRGYQAGLSVSILGRVEVSG